MAYINTIELSGGETAAEIVSCRYVCIRNRGTETVYASRSPGITADAEGVMPTEPGESVVYPDCGKTLYLLGSGKVTVVCTDDNENYFTAAEGNLDDPIKSCRAYRYTDDVEIEIDVSGAKYYGAWGTIAAIGSCLSETEGKTADGLRNSNNVYIGQDVSFISKVPNSGKIYANVMGGTLTILTSDSYKALRDALDIKRAAYGYENGE